MAPTPINFAEQAWINAAHYNNAMDNYQAYLAKNQAGEEDAAAEKLKVLFILLPFQSKSVSRPSVPS